MYMYVLYNVLHIWHIVGMGLKPGYNMMQDLRCVALPLEIHTKWFGWRQCRNSFYFLLIQIIFICTFSRNAMQQKLLCHTINQPLVYIGLLYLFGSFYTEHGCYCGIRLLYSLWLLYSTGQYALSLCGNYPVHVCTAGLCVWSRQFVYVRMYVYVYMSTKKQAV